MYISQYKVDDTPLGEGGMGRILKAVDPEGKVVAIKEILPEYAADVEMRFRINQERNILDRLDNPAIVRTYQSFMLNDKYYIVMELVDGLNLEQYVLEHGPFKEKEAVEIMSQVLEVMQYVHNEKVVHRDLKPNNIMIRTDGSVCILDFGIAKDLRSHSHTMAGMVLGSDGYMSPEQASAMDIDCRSDIYSLGCVLFYMLTGYHAYPPQESSALMLDALINKPFPRLSKYVKGTSKKMQQVLDKATDKNMVKRYRHCYDFANALREAVGLPPQPMPGGGTVQVARNAHLSISVGRLNPGNPGACQIEINDPTMRVSSHHADIELKSFTGGTYFIFHDRSTNGTLINGNMIHRMDFHQPIGAPDPVIYLASDPNCQLDWAKVKQMLLDMANKEPELSAAAPEPEPELPEPLYEEEATPRFSKRLLITIACCLAGVVIIVCAFAFSSHVVIQALGSALGAILITLGGMRALGKL